jgi:PAS domain S-box-containing protein
MAVAKLIKKNTIMLNAILDSLYSAVVGIDIQGHILYLNSTAEKILGPLTEISGQLLDNLIPDINVKDAIGGSRCSIGVKITFLNKVFITNVTPVFENGKTIGAAAVLLDISKVQELSDQLKQMEQLNHELNTLFESSADGLVISSADGKLLKINRAYEQIVGVKAEEFIGQPAEEVVRRGFMKSVVTPKVIENRRVVTIINKIGDKDVLLTGTPVFDDEGNLIRVIANVRDLTELNSLKRQLSESAVKLALYHTELSRLNAETIVGDIIINSPEMQRVFDLALRVAPIDITVLISGESGVGKEVVARMIHETSRRSQKAFVKINCGALPATLIESELFGYEQGAFTGANPKGKEGLFETASGGTLLLDEIGDLPLDLQVKLLRAIQEQEFTRLGGTKPVRVDVRIIASSNQDLKQLVNAGRFRRDLFFRLDIVSICVPALREHASDIPALVDFFIRRFGKKYNLLKKVPSKLMEKFLNYDWPGNIRELENTIERLVVLSPNDWLDIDLFEPAKFQASDIYAEPSVSTNGSTERQVILNAYRRFRSTRKVAALLNVNQSTIVRKLKKYRKEAYVQ